jgi:hypothetical protein
MGVGEMNKVQFTRFRVDTLGLAAARCRGGAIAYVFMDWRHMGELLNAGEQVFSELKNLCMEQDQRRHGEFLQVEARVNFRVLFSCESLTHFEMILSSNGCRWALLCASARAKYAKSCHLFPWQGSKNRACDHFDIMARSVSCSSSLPVGRHASAIVPVRLRLKSRKISRAALWPGAPVTPPPGWPPEPHK